jgi:CHAT domain-containing protein/tetratricopeptide (TPR) repeat protein
MRDHPVSDEQALLSLCALMPYFNREHVRQLSNVEPQLIEQLFSDDLVGAVPEHAGMYRLREHTVEIVLDKLRRDWPEGERILHSHVVQYFENILILRGAGSTLDNEELYVYHFDALCSLLARNMEWPAIRQFVARGRQLALNRRQHHHRVALFDAYAAIRMQEYSYGESMLGDLLAQADLEPDLRFKSLRGLATAAFFKTRFDQAIELNQQVLSLGRETNDRMYQAVALLNLAFIHLELEEYRQALVHCLQSLRMFRGIHDWAHEVNALYHAGLCSMYLGRWQRAETYCSRATRLYEQYRMPAYLGLVSWQRGYLQHILGDEIASEAHYLRAIEIAAAAQGGQMTLAMDAHLYLGILYHTQGRLAEALQQYDLALDCAYQLNHQQRASQLHFHRGRTLYRQGHHEAALESYRAAIVAIEALRGATEREDVKISLLGTTQQLYEAIVLLLLELGRDAEAFHFVERARSRAFLDMLAKKPDQNRDVSLPDVPAALAHEIVTLAEMRAGLPEDALLLEYFTAGVLPRGEHLLNSIPAENTRLREHLTHPPQVILFAVARDAFAVHRLNLNPNSLRPPIGDRYPGRHLLHGRLPQSLYDRLVAPAADLLAVRDTLYVVPHGPLHYVPFGALRAPDDQPLLRAGGPSLAQAPSATILLRHCLGRAGTRRGGMLAIGFDDPQGEQPLRFAEVEARHVARMFGVRARTGNTSKSQHLRVAGPRARWLHIASHARYRPEDPLGSELYLGPGDALSARAIIRDLSLRAELVTLSSCTSGVSHVVPGDELLGLQRAFLFAGAPAVVCTRWEARDLVALLVMDRFYAGLHAGRAPADSLRDAQVFVRELTREQLAELIDTWQAEVGNLAAELEDLQDQSPDTRPFADPLFWAPFMLIGRA